MKQSDIITAVLVGGIAVFGAYLAVNSLMGNPDEAKVTFKTIAPISSSIAEPDPEVFNRDALNPTVEVSISGCEDKDDNGILDEEELQECGIQSEGEEE